MKTNYIKVYLLDKKCGVDRLVKLLTTSTCNFTPGQLLGLSYKLGDTPALANPDKACGLRPQIVVDSFLIYLACS